MYLISLLYRRIRRPHLGLKFSAISLLNPVHVEDILIKHKIKEGLIVLEVILFVVAFLSLLVLSFVLRITYCKFAIQPQVSADSTAEKCGIRVGDVVERVNGKCISTVVEVSALYVYYC
jgi:hypothetical protein